MFITKKQYNVAKHITSKWIKGADLDRYTLSVLNIDTELVSYIAAKDDREKELVINKNDVYQEDHKGDKNFMIEIGDVLWNGNFEFTYKAVYFNEDLIYFDPKHTFYKNNNSR